MLIDVRRDTVAVFRVMDVSGRIKSILSLVMLLRIANEDGGNYFAFPDFDRNLF